MFLFLNMVPFQGTFVHSGGGGVSLLARVGGKQNKAFL